MLGVLQDLLDKHIKLGGSCGGNCGGFPGSILKVLDANAPPCLLHSGRRSHVTPAPKSPPAAAPGQQ